MDLHLYKQKLELIIVGEGASRAEWLPEPISITL